MFEHRLSSSLYSYIFCLCYSFGEESFSYVIFAEITREGIYTPRKSHFSFFFPRHLSISLTGFIKISITINIHLLFVLNNITHTLLTPTLPTLTLLTLTYSPFFTHPIFTYPSSTYPFIYTPNHTMSDANQTRIEELEKTVSGDTDMTFLINSCQRNSRSPLYVTESSISRTC